MTTDETIKILATLKAAYPHAYKDMTKRDAEAMINLWTVMFSADRYEDVNAAVGSLIATRTVGYAPTVGEVKEELKKVTGDQLGFASSPSFKRSIQEFLRNPDLVSGRNERLLSSGSEPERPEYEGN